MGLININLELLIILLKNSLKIELNFILILTTLYNFIKDNFSQNINYFNIENEKSII